MKLEKLRVSVAGLGLIGQVHLVNYLSHPNVEVVALADTDPERRAGKLNRLHGNLDEFTKEPIALGEFRSYEDPFKMCEDKDIDIISVCLPTDLHAAVTLKALENGKHVFCEKPPALTSREAIRLTVTAEAMGKTLMFGHVLHFWAEYVEAGKIIESKKYGRSLAASFARCSSRPAWSIGGAEQGWFGNPERSGGVAVDLHIHDADIAVWWWGRPQEIDASGAFIGNMPSVIHSRWRFRDGLIAQFEATWETVTTMPFYFNFKVTMERATLLFDSRNADGLQLATEDKLVSIPLKKAEAYRLEDYYFIDCILHGKPVDRCPPESSILSLDCVLEEARQIAERHRGITSV
ncbi:MAG: putative oxidoreductase YcjS [candidate division BRC1 bacterium ADurb.Bin183]|nr:MAG: putative oxidoreductase YcjS [candidate division BRC1 bacterium ADurb.Bin183]